MKVLLTVLIIILIALQYRLWFGGGSIQEVWRLNQESKLAKAEMLRLRGRNQALEAEVADLKSGLDAIEERARSELGMIDSDEDFYQFVRERGAKANVKTLELQTPQPDKGRLLIDRSGAPGLLDAAAESRLELPATSAEPGAPVVSGATGVVEPAQAPDSSNEPGTTGVPDVPGVTETPGVPAGTQ